MADLACSAYAAILAQDWEVLRVLLHPYVRWTDARGQVVRGRSKVLAMLKEAGTPDPPVEVELRDGQIYRWCGQRGCT